MTYVFQQLEPQCARGTFREEQMTDSRYDAEVKYDGDRRIAQFCETGVTHEPLVRFTGRTRSKVDKKFVEKTMNVPHLSKSDLVTAGIREGTAAGMRIARNARELHGTVLDGEMVVALSACSPELRAQLLADTGGRSKYVTSIMGSSASEAIAKQVRNGWLRYIVFDCLWYKGKDIRGLAQEDRRAFMLDAVKEWGNPFAAPAATCPDPQRKREWLESLWQLGEEGIILKLRSAAYGKAHQSTWVKVKNVINFDAVIMGYKEASLTSEKVNGETSETKFAANGWIGAVLLGQYVNGKLTEVASISGMDEALRAELSAHRKKYLGRVVEGKANGRELTGRFRHPQWKRFRDDKRAKDCVYRRNES